MMVLPIVALPMTIPATMVLAMMVLPIVALPMTIPATTIPATTVLANLPMANLPMAIRSSMTEPVVAGSFTGSCRRPQGEEVGWLAGWSILRAFPLAQVGVFSAALVLGLVLVVAGAPALVPLAAAGTVAGGLAPRICIDGRSSLSGAAALRASWASATCSTRPAYTSLASATGKWSGRNP